MDQLFFFNDTATTEIYTLSLHDALPISPAEGLIAGKTARGTPKRASSSLSQARVRSEEHTSELQSQSNLVCRLLLEKKNKILINYHISYIHRKYRSTITRRGMLLQHLTY